MSDDERVTYVCTDCGAAYCKLWRPAQTFSPSLRCANCVARRDDTTYLASLDKQGKSVTISEFKFDHEHRTYCLGGYHVPAVPTSDWEAYWGYLAITEEGLAWWHYLPTFPSSNVGDQRV